MHNRNGLRRMIIAVAFFVSLVTLPLATEPPEEPTPQTIEALQQAVRRILDKYNVTGAGIALVSKDGVIWSGGIGDADVAAGRPITAETVFRLGSTSKTLIAMALLKLQEEGKLSLEHKVKDIVPEITIVNPWEQSDPVRIVHLLEHTSGFDDMEPAEIYNLDDPPDISLSDVLQRFQGAQRVRWRPGTRMSYSNPGYGLAGYIVEKVSGRKFEEYIKQELLKPLRMNNSDFRLSDSNRKLLAQGYNKFQQPVEYRNIYLRPAGDLKSSPADMAQLIRLFLNRGKVAEIQLLRPESIARMEEVQTTEAARAGLKKGYGLGLFAEMRGGRVWYGHHGGILGFLSTFQYSPQQGVGYGVFINRISVEAWNELKNLLSEYLLREQPTRSFPQIELSETQLSEYVGYYEKTNPRNHKLRILDALAGGKRVVLKSGRLEIGPLLGKKRVLVPVSRKQFRYETEPEASLIFFTGADGRWRLAGPSYYGEEVPPWWAWSRFALLVGAAGLLLLFAITAVIWIPVQLVRKKARFVATVPAAATLLASLSLVATLILLPLALVDLETVGTKNAVTLSLLLGSWLWPISALMSFAIALWYLGQGKSMMLRTLTVLAAVACLGITVYFVSWGAVGFKLF